MARFNEDLTNLAAPNAAAEAKRRVERELAKLGVLQELSKSSQQRVTDRVFTTTRTYQLIKARFQQTPDRTGFSSRGLRRLTTRLQRLRRVFNDLVDECARLDPSGGLRDWIGADHVAEVLDEFESRADVLWDTGDTPGKATTVRLQDVRVHCSLLILFTLEACGTRRGPASAMVAEIENVFWEGNIRETDEDTNRKRSSAVLKRLARIPFSR